MIKTDLITKQEIIDLFKDYGIHVYPEQQAIQYYSKNDKWLGNYFLKTEIFHCNLGIFSKIIDFKITNTYSESIKLLNSTIEEIIKRKIYYS